MAPPPSRFDVFCGAAFDLLERSQVRYLVIGGLAVVAVGEPRTTGDVDVLAFVTEADAHRLIAEARGAGFEAEDEVERRRLRETGTLRFRHAPFQLDVITASMPFEEEAFRRATPQRMFGRALRFPSPEDLILFKVLAGRDKDLLDAVGVARRHAATLDRHYVDATLRPICDLAEDLGAWQRWQAVLRRAQES
jgi:Nucleotidyltransferase of unknown function (DUF6036)